MIRTFVRFEFLTRSSKDLKVNVGNALFFICENQDSSISQKAFIIFARNMKDWMVCRRVSMNIRLYHGWLPQSRNVGQALGLI